MHIVLVLYICLWIDCSSRVFVETFRVVMCCMYYSHIRPSVVFHIIRYYRIFHETLQLPANFLSSERFFIFLLVFFFKQKTAYEISACLVGSEMCIRDRYDTLSSPSRVSTKSPATLSTAACIHERHCPVLRVSPIASSLPVSYTHLTLPTNREV